MEIKSIVFDSHMIAEDIHELHAIRKQIHRAYAWQ